MLKSVMRKFRKHRQAPNAFAAFAQVEQSSRDLARELFFVSAGEIEQDLQKRDEATRILFQALVERTSAKLIDEGLSEEAAAIFVNLASDKGMEAFSAEWKMLASRSAEGGHA